MTASRSAITGRLVSIVRHQQDRRRKVRVQSVQKRVHVVAECGIQSAEGLVEE